MVAEKAADIILGKTPLAAASVNVWQDQQWQNRQRLNPPLASDPVLSSEKENH
jgi:choline dehydrogenase